MSALCGLPRAAALAQFAHVLYLYRATVFDLDVPNFDSLSFEEKHWYLQEAEAVLARLKPAALGSSPLFEQVANVARILGFRSENR